MRPPKHIRDAKKAAISAAKADYMQNGAEKSTFKASDGKTLGYRLSPDMKQGYQAHIHFSPLAPVAKTFSQVFKGNNSNADKSLSPKQLGRKYNPVDADLYTDKLEVHGGSREEVKIRIGTTPPRKLLLTDKVTGEKYLARIPAQPKYQDVGTTGIFPKDGGK